ncbi:MAG: transposase [Methanomassiliicoccus sp.]|nr:transposase [Methanomassiliicoccus sp.]
MAAEHHWEVMALEVMPDHVHLFISADLASHPNSCEEETIDSNSFLLRKRHNLTAVMLQKYIEDRTMNRPHAQDLQHKARTRF